MISVIIPTYNSEKTIADCIGALEKQATDQRFEIIVVDDGSKDKTAEAVKPFKTVRFFQMAHKGPAFARDFGAKMAKGEILLFTDSDCAPEKNWIAEMVAPFSEKSVAGVSGTYRTNQKEIIARFAQYEIEARHEKMARQESIDFIGTFSAGYRKKIFSEFGGFDTSFSTSAGEDPELSFRISEAGHRMVFAPNAIVYHTHPDTVGKYLKQKFRNSYWRVYVYAKRKKTFKGGHSYTPISAILEAMFAGMSVLWLMVLISSMMAYKETNMLSIISAFMALGSLLLTTVPSYSLIGHILKKDFAVGIMAPFIILARAFATAFGITLGVVRRRI